MFLNLSMTGVYGVNEELALLAAVRGNGGRNLFDSWESFSGSDRVQWVVLQKQTPYLYPVD